MQYGLLYATLVRCLLSAEHKGWLLPWLSQAMSELGTHSGLLPIVMLTGEVRVCSLRTYL